MPIKDYNTDPDLNTTISGINIAEGCAPSGINNAIRQLMADIKENSTEVENFLEAEVGTIREDTLAAAQQAAASGGGGEVGGVTLEGVAAAVARMEALVASMDEARVGVPFPWPSNEGPAGCLLCNGAAVSRTMYARLFAVMGTTWGEGDGSTTFNLPNLTDRFIQGSGTAGIYKEAGAPGIMGSIHGAKEVRFNSATGAFTLTDKGTSGFGENNDSDYHTAIFDASLSNPIYGNSDTIQPPALTMRYFVRY